MADTAYRHGVRRVNDNTAAPFARLELGIGSDLPGHGAQVETFRRVEFGVDLQFGNEQKLAD